MRTCLFPAKLGRCIFEYCQTRWVTRAPASSPIDLHVTKASLRSVRSHQHVRCAAAAGGSVLIAETCETVLSAEEMLRAAVAFLIADLKTALTMLDDAALLSAVKKSRAYSNAASAYQNALEACSQLTLTPKQAMALDELQEQLKRALACYLP